MIHKTFKIDLESLLLIKLGVSWCFWEVGVNIDSLWIEYRLYVDSNGAESSGLGVQPTIKTKESQHKTLKS